jgi:hypothetical protein
MSLADAARPGGRTRRFRNETRIVEELAAGSTYPQAAEAAGVSLATVKRAAVDPRVQAAVRQAQADERAERAKQRRVVQRSLERLAGFSLAKLQEVLLSQSASDGVKVQAAATILKHAAPVLVEVTVAEDEVQRLDEGPTLEELFELPEGADEVNVIQLARAVADRVKAHEGVVDGQARGKPPEQQAQERVWEDERRQAMRVPLPSSPAQEPPQEDQVRRSVAAQREAEQRQEEDVQALAAARERVEADRMRMERAGLVPPPPPWEATAQDRLEQLRRGNGRVR